MKNKSEQIEEIINEFTDALPVLRASICASQENVASAIGISRQTYCLLEKKKKPLSWTVFLALVLFFGVNEKSLKMMMHKKHFITIVKEQLHL